MEEQQIGWIAAIIIGGMERRWANSGPRRTHGVPPRSARALAIAFLYAIGTGIGGVAGSWL
jgi:hypothetical protein